MKKIMCVISLSLCTLGIQAGMAMRGAGQKAMQLKNQLVNALNVKNLNQMSPMTFQGWVNTQLGRFAVLVKIPNENQNAMRLFRQLREKIARSNKYNMLNALQKQVFGFPLSAAEQAELRMAQAQVEEGPIMTFEEYAAQLPALPEQTEEELLELSGPLEEQTAGIQQMAKFDERGEAKCYLFYNTKIAPQLSALPGGTKPNALREVNKEINSSVCGLLEGAIHAGQVFFFLAYGPFAAPGSGFWSWLPDGKPGVFYVSAAGGLNNLSTNAREALSMIVNKIQNTDKMVTGNQREEVKKAYEYADELLKNITPQWTKFQLFLQPKVATEEQIDKLIYIWTVAVKNNQTLRGMFTTNLSNLFLQSIDIILKGYILQIGNDTTNALFRYILPSVSRLEQVKESEEEASEEIKESIQAPAGFSSEEWDEGIAEVEKYNV